MTEEQSDDQQDDTNSTPATEVDPAFEQMVQPAPDSDVAEQEVAVTEPLRGT
jgi:hypothetical protein